MQVDVSAHIAELLYENESVAVPGLGGFVTNYKPAAIDQVQGKIHPPSKDLIFNKNLVGNDGLLVNYIKRKHDLPFSDAQTTVENYVAEIKEAIDRREIVLFPGIGRLYKDYENNLQFLPDNTNFNTESFGLPTVQFYPVVRSAGKEAGAVSTDTKDRKSSFSTGGILSGRISRWFQKYLAFIAAVSVIIVGMGLYLLFSDKKPDDGEMANLPTSRVNVSPSRVTAEDSIPEDDDLAIEGEDQWETEPEYPQDQLDTEGPTAPPSQKNCIIAIGTFADPDNVEKLVKRIYEEGFEPYIRETEKNTVVGVQMAYDDDAELDAALRTVQEKFDKRARVIKR